MRTVLVGLIGALLAAAGTAALDPTVHIGQHVVTGWERYVVAAAGGTLCATLIWRALRLGPGL